jgi:hypothetical protein
MHVDHANDTGADALAIAAEAPCLAPLSLFPDAEGDPGGPPDLLDCLDILTLEQAFREAGYCLGAPPHVTPRTLRQDAEAVAEAGCPECGSPGVVLTPYHPSAAFRCAGRCPACCAEWEV